MDFFHWKEFTINWIKVLNNKNRKKQWDLSKLKRNGMIKIIVQITFIKKNPLQINEAG